MKNHFLKEIEIIEYKCFKNFKTQNFKRINLISGKNNVGKTVFLEALHLNSELENISNFLNNIGNVTARRNSLNILDQLWNENINKKVLAYEIIDSIEKYSAKSNINNISYNLSKKDGIKEYIYNFNGTSKKVNANELTLSAETNTPNNFIDNFGLNNRNIIDYYASIQKEDKEEYINNCINQFDNSIETFKIIDSIPHCKKNNVYKDINELGDGLRHLISIICALYSSKNGYLYIDEIDNGVHYTQLTQIWEIIFKVSKEVNCQVFAVSHSKEMIESFAKVSKELKDDDISFISLGKNKQDEIKSTVLDQEMFLNELEQNHEIRGW